MTQGILEDITQAFKAKRKIIMREVIEVYDTNRCKGRRQSKRGNNGSAYLELGNANPRVVQDGIPMVNQVQNMIFYGGNMVVI